MVNDKIPLFVIGLMSGTSLDGVDAALLRTDGVSEIEVLGSLAIPYNLKLRKEIRSILGSDEVTEFVRKVERDLTLEHVFAVRKLLTQERLSYSDIRLIGFHGHTIFHQPAIGRTWQVGDAKLLAKKTGIDVIADFRSADMSAGGEGAPLVPVFHSALSRKCELPVVILNLGGVANVTWVGPDNGLVAFDTGPGNALIDDWMYAKEGISQDVDGQLAAIGKVEEGVLKELLKHPYFDRKPPKSLDRNEFDLGLASRLSTADGAATLTAFTAAAVVRSKVFFPITPKYWLVSGGGRNNPSLMGALTKLLEEPVMPVEKMGWNGDCLEAQAFAYLAVRSLYNLPLTYSSTTGVISPTHGGHLFQVAKN